MFSNLACHTHQTHFLPPTIKSMLTVFNVIHNAPKTTECLRLSQNRIESGPSESFLQSAHAVDETAVLSIFLLVSRCWAFGENPFFLEYMLGVLLGKPVRNVPYHSPGSSFFWIVHKYHVVSLKDDQRLLFVVICNISGMSVVSAPLKRRCNGRSINPAT